MQDSLEMINKPSFESSAHGRIEQVLLSIPSWVLRYQRQAEIRCTAAVYRDVFETLNTNVQFLMVTHEEGESHLAEWLKESGVQSRTDVIVVPNRTKLSVWAEDSFTVCTDRSGRRWILQPFSKEHPDETVIAEAIAERTGWGHIETDRSFQSGNILVGDDFWFVGADSVVRVTDFSRKLFLISSRVPVPGFADGFKIRDIQVDGRMWSETCYRGNRRNTVQPSFHIDAFLTLAGRAEDGRYDVLVGDPALAAEILGTTLPDHAMEGVFDDIAVQLQHAGFNVVRNPLPLVYQDNHIAKVRHWYFASANNALVEIDGQKKTVWLPTYGHGQWCALDATDRFNAEIWQQLGFETRLLGNFHPFAMNLGAIHCMTKCVVRS
jgi:hypothetical protein